MIFLKSIASIVGLVLILGGHFQSSAQYEDGPHTTIRFVADVKSVRPGGSFMIGLHMTMDPGWHTYWKNPGEAGLPPMIKWDLPQGVEAGEIQWPAPHKYIEGGEIITFGYEKENMLLIQMTVSADFPAGTTLTIGASVDWLECEKVCIPGSGTAEISLPVKSFEPKPDNEELFARYRSQVPREFSMEEAVELTIRSHRGALELILEPKKPGALTVVDGEVPDFYPETFPEIEVLRTEVQAGPDRAVLRIPVKMYEPGIAPPVFRGLLTYGVEEEEGTRRIRVVETALTQEMTRNLGVVGETIEPAEGILAQEFVIGDSGGWDQPFIVYLVFAMIGGLLLNIMPCVLPVIGLKVFGLVKMGGENPRQVRKLGWLFSLGILFSFLVLALLVILLKTAGEQVGWGFQFQEPVFIIIMSAVVMAFGLSLFGVFEIQLPSFATTGMSEIVTKAGSGGTGAFGSFSEGVFATILATPCTAPILGTALGFAFAQPPGIIIIMFTAVAAGMALPYLILTLRPSWMKILPKPGEWMVTAKQFMGFLMMATLIWLLYILGKQLGMEAVIWTGSFLLTVGMACWLVGRFATLSASRMKYAGTWISAILIVVAGWMWFMQPVLEAKNILSSTSGSELPVDPDEIPWEPFSLATLEGYLADGKPVFIDFTAEWCLTCKVNEKTVLADDEVVERFRNSGLVSLKADWTNRNTEITQLLAKFGRSGVPLYVLFPAGRRNEPIILPEVITPGIVLDGIEKAVEGM